MDLGLARLCGLHRRSDLYYHCLLCSEDSSLAFSEEFCNLQIWHTSLQDILAVEPSPDMAALGQRIQTHRQSIAQDSAQGSQQAQVRWVYRLPSYTMKASGHGARGKKRYKAEALANIIEISMATFFKHDMSVVLV